MHKIDENYKNYFKQKLMISLSEYYDPSITIGTQIPPQEMMMGGGGILRGLLRGLARPTGQLLWKGIFEVPPHVLKSVLNGPYGFMMRTLYRGSSLDDFMRALEDILHFDKSTGTWFQKLPNKWGQTGENWVQVLDNGQTRPVPFNPTQGIPPGYILGAGGALLLVAPTSAEQAPEDELELPPVGPGQEATAPYRQA